MISDSEDRYSNIAIIVIVAALSTAAIVSTIGLLPAAVAPSTTTASL
jgi:hypothetical protein